MAQNNYSAFTLGIFIGFLMLGAYELHQNDEVDQEQKAELLSQFPDKKWEAIIFVKTLDDLSPTFKAPINGKTYFLVNEWPMIGTLHWLGMGALIILSSFFIRRFNLLWWQIVLAYLGVIVASYFIVSFLIWYEYNWAASQFGWTREQAYNFRINYGKSFDSFWIPILAVSLLGIKKIWGAFRWSYS